MGSSQAVEEEQSVHSKALPGHPEMVGARVIPAFLPAKERLFDGRIQRHLVGELLQLKGPAPR